MTASPALIDLEDAVRHTLTQAGLHLINPDTGVSVTTDMHYGCVLIGWNVHDDLPIGNHNAEQVGWGEQHPAVARYRAVKAAVETALVAVLTAHGFVVEPARPGQPIRVHVPGSYCPACDGTGGDHQIGCTAGEQQ
ncbi:hypothetical protein [Kitasatospora sp. NPDC127116]|uniref:hypothetical protein n=1 Tax=Kitasatospora sp. NPDC127116 TaxID=3345367 RepID=UPI00362EFD4E